MEKKTTLMREEFPNPAFVRTHWRSLDGIWQFAFDKGNDFEEQRVETIAYPLEIQVPFCYQSALSGIGTDEDCENVWYNRCFTLTPEELTGGVLLKFGAVDYTAKVWINGAYIGRHDGGHTPFAFEISAHLRAGENRITVKAEDSYSKELPRGKQMWGKKPDMCWYTNTTGIWQSVWMEFVGDNYITGVEVTPDIDKNQAHFSIRARQEQDITLRVVLSQAGKPLGEMTVSPENGRGDVTFSFRESSARAVFDLYWSPEFPVLIDAEVILLWKGVECDRVYTYFGMRKIHVDGDRIFLNNQPLYQRLVLDQGYWPDGLMTAPSGDALKRDVELTKAMGFNGARKHQKIEDPRYYYWADKLGLLVWGELPSAYDFTPDSRRRLTGEMRAFIQRDYNHPCIISWIPLNESWGVHQVADNEQQRDFVRALYYMIKAEDPTRLVGSNDGWEQLETTDFCGVHDYDITPQNAEERYRDAYAVLRSSVNFKPVYARGVQYNGVPILLTEIGGVKLKQTEGWGYNGELADEDEMLAYLKSIMVSIRQYKHVQGFCYTQLTDVMQETNGLLSPEREPRVPVEVLKTIFG